MYIPIYLLLVNLISFILMRVDKSRAKNSQYRIPEKTFFIFAVIGGSVGVLCGMYAFRHKTKHWYFKYGIPLILLVQVAILIYILIK